MNDVQDFAERVKKYYYYRALFCEQLINKAVTVSGSGIEMPPTDFNPFSNFYVDAYVIGCAAIDGLASLWESINQHEFSGNQERFTTFMTALDDRSQMNRICTPFLVFFLERQGIEKPFTDVVKAKWLTNRRDNESHRVYSDPTCLELKSIYEVCHQKYRIPMNLTLKDFTKAISSFTYAALIYKYYRCSFIHEFRASKFVIIFNKRNIISVRKFAASISPSGKTTQVDDIKPQLDVGIGVLTESIRKGADIIFDLIIAKQYIDLPYGANDEIKLKTK